MFLSNWLHGFRKKQVNDGEKAELLQMQQETAVQREQAHGLLYEARVTGAKLAASRHRNHYRILLDEILGGQS